MKQLWRSDVAVACSVVGYPEVRGAVSAASRARRISMRRMESAVVELDDAWALVYSIEFEDPVALFAGALAHRHGLRALDAVHLASALSIPWQECIVVSWDDELRSAAGAEGLAISPA